jgi:peptidoglycan/xylan/chitin deacetylase (PgdA/CDA1 family)
VGGVKTKTLLANALAILVFSACGNLHPLYRVSPAGFAEHSVQKEQTFVPILTYHRFDSTAIGETTLSSSTLEEQLKYIKSNGYTVIPLRSLVDYLRGLGPPPPRHSVVITADDGHKSIYTDMLPIVRRYGVPVTLFVYPSAISNASYAMTWEELKELTATGLFDIQSHTYWHPNFENEKKRLTATEHEELVTAQLMKSREVLQSRLQTRVDLLAWPFGIFNEFLTIKAQQAGYIAGFVLGNRQASSRDSLMALPRYLITEKDKGRLFEQMLRQGEDDPDPTYFGKVTDGITGQAIENAIVTLDNYVTRSDALGNFRIAGPRGLITIRAPGYLRTDAVADEKNTAPLPIRLTPLRPKALYLSFYGVGSTTILGSALRLIETTELNALVIDVKGDRGLISFHTPKPLAEEIGAHKTTTIKDARDLITTLKKKGIYTIARIVVFKDEPLATARPDLAVRTASGSLWYDREGLAWTDPFKTEVWDYNIDVAEQAASAGFDEIQFDYLRFPDSPGLRYSKSNTQENRIEAITGFLRKARQRLTPYNIFLAADLFGYICWNLNDTYIGQRVEELSQELDYLSPMLYPSSFQYGIPGYRNPVDNAYPVVSLSLKQAQKRTGLLPIRFRPWLQAFKDYAFDGRTFGANEIRQQIDAAEQFGSDGWMLWNPHNTYSEAGLKPETAIPP